MLHDRPADEQDLEATLALLKPEEYPVIARYVDVVERAGWMGAEEAGRWRERIGVWARFRGTRRPSSAPPAAEIRDFFPLD